MNNLIINGKVVGCCSRPRERGYGNSAYVFLMEEKYYITIELNDIMSYHVDCDKNSHNCNYVFELVN